MKILGTVLLVGGVIALIITGIDYINDSEAFSIFGLDVTVSKGDATPVIISAAIFVIGLVLVMVGRKK